MEDISGLKTVMTMKKEIDDTEDDTPTAKKVVKLRFTIKQYQAFRDACKVLEALAMDDEKFTNYVKTSLGSDLKTSTITKQFVQPIVDAPTKIPIKVPKASDGPKKQTYFTAPIPSTKKAFELYKKVSDVVQLRYDIKSDKQTCITDIRVMLSKYIIKNKLRNNNGIVLDGFLSKIAENSLRKFIDAGEIVKFEGKGLIPKGNRSVMTSLVNEVAFDE
jgi:hypothetical protein